MPDPLYFRTLRLQHFRNYATLLATFGDGIHCITGDNGQGKTNLLEALHYLSLTRGWQAKTEKFALLEKESFFLCEGELVEGDRQVLIACNYLDGKGKKILINGHPTDRMADHVGRVPVISVLPNDTQLIHGGPGGRRRFIDGFLSQCDAEYLRQLIQYDRVLEQRNALLGQLLERRTWDADLMAPWNAQLIPAGMYLAKARAAFLKEYLPLFRKYFRLIVSEKENPTLELETQLKENTAAEWEQILRASQDRDRYSGRSQAGVHKDDLVFGIDGQAVRNFGSQGQQKTYVVALKLAQYDLLLSRTGKAPLLLLDDIFDKLDEHRLAALARILDGEITGQVFITDTSIERMRHIFAPQHKRQVMYFRVENGRLQSL